VIASSAIARTALPKRPVEGLFEAAQKHARSLHKALDARLSGPEVGLVVILGEPCIGLPIRLARWVFLA